MNGSGGDSDGGDGDGGGDGGGGHINKKKSLPRQPCMWMSTVSIMSSQLLQWLQERGRRD